MNNPRRFLTLAIPALSWLLLLGTTSVRAQTDTVEVQAIVNFEDYDVIYLTDWVDVKTQKLKGQIPNTSFILTTAIDQRKPPAVGTPLDICLYLKVTVQLPGQQPDVLVEAYTKNFKLSGSRTITPGDFAGDNPSSDIDKRKSPYYENTKLRKTLEDQANLYATAHAGTYMISMKILPATRNAQGQLDNNVDPSTNIVWGTASRTIMVPLETASTFTDLIEPKNGAIVNNLAPTFNWTTQAPTVTLRVYEVLCNHRSAQDALGGIPYLTQQLTGASSLTYPTTASRQLQQDKAYVWVVEGDVRTNRGVTQSPSVPFVFRITDDKVGQMLDNFFNQAGGQGQAVFNTLRSDPNYWVYMANCARATIDGRTLTEGDLQNVLNDIAGQQDNSLQVSVENQ